MKIPVVACLIGLLPLPLAAAPTARTAQTPPSLCKPSETVVFSCQTGPKTVSICASADASPTSGTLYYRYGKHESQEKPELELPDSATAPSRAALGDSVAFSGGGGAWLRFSRGQTSYTAYTGIGKWGPRGEVREKAGLVVEQAGKRLATLSCVNQKALSLLGPDWFEKAGIKSGNVDFEFPD